MRDQSQKRLPGRLRGIGVALVISFLLLVPFVVSAMIYVNEEKKLTPPESVQTFQDYLDQMPPPILLRLVKSSEDQTYLEVAGPHMPLWALPSGPPCYVFDKTGTLVDWTPDNGEDALYEKRWSHGSWSREKFSVEEALEWFSTGNDSDQ